MKSVGNRNKGWIICCISNFFKISKRNSQKAWCSKFLLYKVIKIWFRAYFGCFHSLSTSVSCIHYLTLWKIQKISSWDESSHSIREFLIFSSTIFIRSVIPDRIAIFYCIHVLILLLLLLLKYKRKKWWREYSCFNKYKYENWNSLAYFSLLYLYKDDSENIH